MLESSVFARQDKDILFFLLILLLDDAFLLGNTLSI